MNLKADTVSEAAVAAVRGMICDGALAPGRRINEVHLAQSLGISRTPLREALNRLAAEGAIEARARLGFFVRPLTREEFEQVYDIRPLLDPEALRLAGVPSAARIAELEKLNRKLSAVRDAKAAVLLDDSWHLALIENCPNKILLDLINAMMVRTRRYEIALWREIKQAYRASEDHDAILASLRAGDLDAASAALQQNMKSGRAPMLAWLEARAAVGNEQ